VETHGEAYATEIVGDDIILSTINRRCPYNKYDFVAQFLFTPVVRTTISYTPLMHEKRCLPSISLARSKKRVYEPT